MNQPVEKIPVVAASETEQALYEVRRKIYPRIVQGKFHYWRVALVWITQLIFYGLPWINWNERQAVLFDLGARKFYIFGLVLWPQDFIFLTALLVISALALFLFTAVAGRLFCGYACPQSVYTEIFIWIERWVEGDRPKQMKLDKEAFSFRKFRVKATKHALWIAVALWTGFTFVGYFTPIKLLGGEVLALNTGPWESFWVLFYGFATYGNAGWMREQVCKYMCPYARFQSVMFDSDTLIVTYDPERGEPRGSRKRSADHRGQGLGDCVDCGICVQVCPTGIDIRRGLQYECIGCGLCIDGCNQVMDKMGYQRGLIRYSTENVIQHRYADRDILGHIMRPRTLVYSGVLLAITAAMIATLALRVPLKVNVIRDRVNLVRDTEDGWVENVYRLQIMNTTEEPRLVNVAADGLPGIRLVSEEHPVRLGAAGSRILAVRLQVDPARVERGSHRVEIRVQAVDDPKVAVSEKTSFLLR